MERLYDKKDIWYERAALYLKNKYSKNKVFVDVGCQGQTLEKFKKLFQPEMSYGFEPLPEEFEKTKNRYAESENVEIIQKAASDSSGSGFIYPGKKSTEQSSLIPSLKTEEEGIEITKIRLDEWAKNRGLDRIDVIKIDTEGHEHHVLKGMGDLLHETRMVISEVRFCDIFGRDEFHEITSHVAEYGLYIFGFPFTDTIEYGPLNYGDVIYYRGKD
jgi:FkbM family methyltransferase